MNLQKHFIKPIAYSILALSVSSIAISSALASPYNNGLAAERNTPQIERRIRTEYAPTTSGNSFFAQPQAEYTGQVQTQAQPQAAPRGGIIDVSSQAATSGKTYRDGSILGGTCCEANENQDNSIFPGYGCGGRDKNQDNSMIPGQGCGGYGKACDRIVPVKASPCTLNPKACKTKKAKVEVQTPETIRYNFVQNYVMKPRHDVYSSIHNQCGKFAPIQLEWVDFKLNGDDINGNLAQKLGNYRFRIFGCRRFNKEAILNQGRLMEQNMKLINVFDEKFKDCFNIVKIPNSVCTEETPSPLPDYVISAEITNYFMNICDKYNWNEASMANQRIGSSEIKVKWTITDINHNQVYWTGETDGYGDLLRGEENGEILLVEKAFADAANNLKNHPGFLNQVSKKIAPAEKEGQRELYILNERKNNPIKCQYTNHEAEDNRVTKYVYTPQNGPMEQPTAQPSTQKAPSRQQPTGLLPMAGGAGALTQTTTPATTTSAPIKVTQTTEIITENVEGPNGPAILVKQKVTSNDIPLTRDKPVAQPAPQQPQPVLQDEEIVVKGLNIEESAAPAPQMVEESAAPAPQMVEESAAPAPQMVEESAQSAEILLSSEPAPEPYDPSMSAQPTQMRYQAKKALAQEPLIKTQAMEEGGSKSSSSETTGGTEGSGIGVSSILPGVAGAAAGAVAAVVDAVAPETPCNNMTLFGPDCDCNNKTMRGCEDNKTMRGCEDNTLDEPCDKCGGLFGSFKEGCGVEEDGGVKTLGAITQESWIEVPVEDKSAIAAQNMLCIVERAPYDVPLTPEDVYKIRASIISITNTQGKQGAGLIVSEQFVLTSADMITTAQDSYKLKTINGKEFTGHPVRINTDKNTALLYLDDKMEYTPLSLNLSLPPIDQKTYMSLGILDFNTGEGYLEDAGKISGYRYSEQKGTEIIVDTFVQNITLGGALIDKNGTITGFAHSGADSEENTDFFLPIATALKSLGLEICGKQIQDIPVKNETISEAILFNTGSKEPLPLDKTERK